MGLIFATRPSALARWQTQWIIRALQSAWPGRHRAGNHHSGRPIIACIGPITAAAARDKGLVVDLVAEEYTIEGLVDILNRHVGKE